MTKKIITTDWDDTIMLYDHNVPDLIMSPLQFSFNIPLIKELKELQDNGSEIHVVTFRAQEVKLFFEGLNGTQIEPSLYYLEDEYGLKISKVHYTNGECKTKKIKELNAIRHYDDSTQVCCMIAINTETWPICVDINRKEENSLMKELLTQGRVTMWTPKNYEC
jgi:hypothetical protein